MAWTTRRRGTGDRERDRERDRELDMAWTTRRRGTGDRERLRLRLLERLRLLRTGCLEDLLQDIEG